ncbi:MAG: hemerythrin domain-containing protein [Betaproteobacteria bacterium]|nr:hemerythrin domain-containing protein [Betaproteobacteria bacterium]
MTCISELLTADHRRCDGLFEAAVRAAESADWDGCRRELDAFRAALSRHMAIEEEILFPAFEAATGVAAGPTQVMRYEHQQMLGLLDQLHAALAASDAQRFDDSAKSFAEMMATHGAKEENILYPLCDEALPAVTGESLQKRAPEK